jgi:hypothetical protein
VDVLKCQPTLHDDTEENRENPRQGQPISELRVVACYPGILGLHERESISGSAERMPRPVVVFPMRYEHHLRITK